MSLSEAAGRVVRAAADGGLHIEVSAFPEGTRTAADAAAAIGCELSAIAKSLVFVAGGRPVVVLMTGDRRVDPARLAEECGTPDARRASPEEARAATGFAVGGTPAFGYPEPLEVLADVGLQRHEVVWSAAGTAVEVYPVGPGDLVEAAGARWVDVAGGPV